MSMQRGGCRRSAGAGQFGICGRAPSAIGAAILCIGLCLTVAGCGSVGIALGTAGPALTSVSFDSIDGPPPEIFHRFFSSLNEEATAHRIAVLPAGGAASYRIRGYLAAHSNGAATSIAWAWDVYDAGLHRAFRLGGEEGAGAARLDPGRTEWAAADEAMLRRIAHAGMEQFVDFLASASTAPEPAPSAPARSGSVVAGLRDSRPEAAGAAARDDAGATVAAFDSAAIPLPRGRPARANMTRTAKLAEAVPAR
jgi:hypothetical protein